MSDFYGAPPFTEYTIPKERLTAPEVFWERDEFGLRAWVGKAYVGRVFKESVCSTPVWIATSVLPTKIGYKSRQFPTEEGARARI